MQQFYVDIRERDQWHNRGQRNRYQKQRDRVHQHQVDNCEWDQQHNCTQQPYVDIRERDP